MGIFRLFFLMIFASHCFATSSVKENPTKSVWEEQKIFFQENGYLWIKNFYSREQVALLQLWADEVHAASQNLLLLDEPTHHLDIESIEALIDAIETFQGAALIVTHSEWMLRRIPFNKLVVCHKQKQELFSGTYDEFLEKVGWQEEKGDKKIPEKQEKGKKEPKLKPVKGEIKACEDKIALLESNIEKNNEKLLSISQSGKYLEIQALLSQTEKDQQEIDKLYERLGYLYGQS